MSPLSLAVLLAVTCLIYWCLPQASARRSLLIAAGVAALAADGPGYVVLIAFQSAVAFFVGRKLREDIPRRSVYLALVTSWFVGCLILAKVRLAFLGPPPSELLPATMSHAIGIGFSYITLRLIQYLVESYRRSIPDLGFFEALNYFLFFPTLLAGPVNRIDTFFAQEMQPRARPSAVQINVSLLRILGGLIKKFVLADSLRQVIDPVVLQPDAFSKLRTLATLGLCTWRIYLEFSGYSDIALGTGALFGYRIPENFNWPLFKPNIAQFWRSWHISFHDFLRDYFFLPFFGVGATRAKIYVGLLSTMLVVHLWQGLSLNFLLFGLIHGSALMAWQRFQEIKQRRPLLTRCMNSRIGGILSTVLTFSFLSSIILMPYANLDREWHVLVRLFA